MAAEQFILETMMSTTFTWLLTLGEDRLLCLYCHHAYKAFAFQALPECGQEAGVLRKSGSMGGTGSAFQALPDRGALF